MIVVYPVHPRDEELALNNARWWNELGGCAGHECLLVYDQRVNPELLTSLASELHRCFKEIYQLRAGANIDGWPEGANYMFRIAMGWLTQRTYKYFLWMEPDAAPLKENWMTALEQEYVRGGKPFMGGRVEGVYEGKQVPVHMTGIAVYCNPIYEHAGEAYRAFDVAWDIAAKDQIVPKAYFTGMFCHAWHHPGFKSMLEVDAIPSKAVIYHGVKDGSLLNLLRQKRSGSLTIQAPERVKESVPIVSDSPAPHSSVEAGDAMFSKLKQKFGDIPEPGDIALPAIHKLPGDIWVIEGDMISGVIKEKGRLDADPLIPKITNYMKPGDIVIDGGAFVGDHAIAYSQAVGAEGKVFCFEPNQVAYDCLVHNLQRCENVSCYQMALGDKEGRVTMSRDKNHEGGAWVSGNSGVIEMVAFDQSGLKPNLIKLDLEGYELHALKGMVKTVMQYRPILVIEINEEALTRQKVAIGDVFSWLVRHHYFPEMLHEYPDSKTPLYDIVAFPAKSSGEIPETG